MEMMPPLGLRPKFIVMEKRLAEVNSAISRYLEANWPIPSEWLEERQEIIDYLRGRKS